jgi:hypothetical protein
MIIARHLSRAKHAKDAEVKSKRVYKRDLCELGAPFGYAQDMLGARKFL